jgi:protein-S-isoprenylcysteine O-methyltransferase Ste14
MRSLDTRKVVIAIFFASLALLAVLLVALGYWLDGWLRLPVLILRAANTAVGVTLILVGAGLVTWSVHVQYAIGKGTPAPMVATQRLVVEGPYAYSRNPMTLGALLFYLGIGIGMGSLAAITLVLLVFAGLLTYIYSHETQELEGRFGAAYLDYKRRTPFLLPYPRLKYGRGRSF